MSRKQYPEKNEQAEENSNLVTMTDNPYYLRDIAFTQIREFGMNEKVKTIISCLEEQTPKTGSNICYIVLAQIYEKGGDSENAEKYCKLAEEHTRQDDFQDVLTFFVEFKNKLEECGKDEDYIYQLHDMADRVDHWIELFDSGVIEEHEFFKNAMRDADMLEDWLNMAQYLENNPEWCREFLEKAREETENYGDDKEWDMLADSWEQLTGDKVQADFFRKKAEKERLKSN